LVLSEWPVTYRLLLKSAPLVEILEKAVRRLTKGRTGVLDLAGIPSIRLFIPGRRSGIIRPTTLQCIDDGERLFVVGSNWGREGDPSWALNLAARTRVRAKRRKADYESEVREVLGAERAEAWASILRAWPNYELAQEMVPGRPFRIFALTGPGA
jgi:deazaflavin-dependent oxidoreductase (nitroreductase family)